MNRQPLFLVRAIGLAGSLAVALACSGCAKAAMPETAAYAPSAPAPGADTSPTLAARTPEQQRATSAASPNATPAATTSPSLAKSSDGKAPRLEPAAAPLLIYEAQLGVQVRRESFPGAIERAIDVAESLGGYLLSRSDSGVQIRVPSASFRAALKQLDQLGTVTRRSVSAQDVSEQFHDLEVRLKNLESVRNRLEQFLARATNVTEALTVGKELENVTRQIDEIKGRLQYLKTRAAYSLITLSLEPKPADVVAKAASGPPPPPPPRPAKLPVEWLHEVGLDELLRME